MKLILKVMTLAISSAVLFAAPTRAAYILTYSDSANGIVGIGSGTINFNALSEFGSSNFDGLFVNSGAFSIGSGNSVVYGGDDTFFGPESLSATDLAPLYSVKTAGPVVALQNAGYTNAIVVPADYVSGTLLGVSTVQYAVGTTIAGLALSANEFVYRWGAGADADTLTVRFTPAADAVPEPASWAMMLGGFGLIGGTMRRRKHGYIRTTIALA